MKIGPRKPSLKKSVKSRTTGKVKRQVKKSINPTYGKKGMGWVNDPKKAAYNKVYNKTSFDAMDGLKNDSSNTDDDVVTCLSCGCIAFIIIILFIIIFLIL
ncbi:hypothetical protein ABE450_001062 [Clostridium perfringens]|jgi:hypothetical protein|uniref:Gp2 n=4 Tax=Clostridium perfringens TaxID=1502 RepID=A0AAN3ZLP4_CLOPF|nr:MULTISPECIES: hypothetical protein [Clostridium]ABG84883.1 conserved hypothetical protein [Clostridium perfringens ATCC 13124]EDT22483.1 conserved hypothetical protein [Clostridium perfringens B str. ATCC 3626]EGT0683323.1 hypothetical protein [Clostridium perfringens]EGT0685753.1 hypothetical protein [Clostridium perfringens]EJT6167421.1 hypothetical protein [Clostridium perfringens]